MTSSTGLSLDGNTTLPGEPRFPGLLDQGLLKNCFAECVGTYLLVFFGCGAVRSAVLTGSLSGLWQVAVGWGVAIMLAISVVGPISGAQINPAISVGLALRGRLGWRLVGPYMAAPLAGAFLAAATLYGLFSPWLSAKEMEKGGKRGQSGSELSAMCYGEYFPNPAPLATAPGPYCPQKAERLAQVVSEPIAFFPEMLGTMILAIVVMALTDPKSDQRAGPLTPVFIGLTMSALISVMAPLTQACFNPARNLRPRLFAFLAGWGKIALPGSTPMGFLAVYVFGPMIGVIAGAYIYDLTLYPSNVRS